MHVVCLYDLCVMCVCDLFGGFMVGVMCEMSVSYNMVSYVVNHIASAVLSRRVGEYAK